MTDQLSDGYYLLKSALVKSLTKPISVTVHSPMPLDHNQLKRIIAEGLHAGVNQNYLNNTVTEAEAEDLHQFIDQEMRNV